MKKVRQSYIRWAVLGALLAFIWFASISSEIGEWYALNLYPGISIILSGISSVLPFSLDEWVVVGAVVLLAGYPFYARMCKKSKWLSILGGELEILVWVYVWFYWGWGMNYYRYTFFQRAEVKPATYDEDLFNGFLSTYTDSLKASFNACREAAVFNTVDLFAPYSQETKRCIDSDVTEEVCAFRVADVQEKIKDSFGRVPDNYGLTVPKDYQKPKRLSFNALYSNVGVLGFMGPFFAESHVNHELSVLEYPFTYAHELSHLLGVTSEAEANLWAYIICTQSADALIRFSGYFGLFSYVWSNNHYLLSAAEFEKWEASVPAEVMAAFYRTHAYWSLRHNKTLGKIQSSIYSFYLKRNRISTGIKNYGQVIGLLLSLPDYSIELDKK